MNRRLAGDQRSSLSREGGRLPSQPSPVAISATSPRQPHRANAANTPSISLPVDVSSIGSVADCSEMPSDRR
jgi:hypothetical protein